MKHKNWLTSLKIKSVIVLVSAMTIYNSGAQAEFIAKEEFKSVINTDPVISKKFDYIFQGHQPEIVKVAEGVYLAKSFGQGNAVLVEGDDSAAIFDVGDSYEHGKAMLTELRKHTKKPIKAVIYSHFHFDHIFGGKAWIEAADKDVQIIAHESTAKYLNERVSAMAPRTDWGLAMQFGLFLDESCAVGEGPLCSGVHGIQFPRVGSTKGHKRHVIYPNRTFRDRMTLDLGNLEVELIHSPSETPDNIIMWIPKRKTILTGDSLTPTLPPIFTARGQRVRDPEGYLSSLDLMRSLNPEHVVPSHGPAFSGPLAQNVLMTYRDAVAFMYHQTVRMINKGMGPEEIASKLVLPPQLANHPLLGTWYNDLQTQVRGIYGYLVGHYNDVAEMPLLAPETEDTNMIALAGGPKPYLKKLQAAYDNGDYTWVARAASHLIRIEPENQAVKDLKASALRVLAGQSISGSHRHFYLQHAAALEGLIDVTMKARFSADDVSTVPVDSLIKQIPFRLDVSTAMQKKQSYTVNINDSKQTYVIQLRSGIAEVFNADENSKADISMDSQSFRLFYIGLLPLDEGFEQGKMKGDKALAVSFFSHFDWPKNAK
ncbi:MAG: MBL fold metallo-hydrolase [Colwellia sp.]|nr:MBL fold metallo-hydrolase [Colwellia sp.]MCW9081171.1 MBL fold metallo-hydrolase [Colwellia sp.]